MGKIKALQKLLHAYAPVDQVDLVGAAPQNIVLELELVGGNDLCLVSGSAKKVPEQLILARCSGKGRPEFKNRDPGLGFTAELLVGAQ